MSFRIRLKGSTPVALEDVGSYLSSLPGLHREADTYVYADEESVSLVIRPSAVDGRVEHLDVEVPMSVSAPGAERLAEFIAALARRFRWQIREVGRHALLTEDDVRRRASGSAGLAAAAAGCLGRAGLLTIAAAGGCFATLLIARALTC